jgi:hypothetical protein
LEKRKNFNAPYLRQILGSGWSYILNVKPDSHKCLFKQFEKKRAGGATRSYRESEGQVESGIKNGQMAYGGAKVDVM